MAREISVEERIRRAEERYNNRNMKQKKENYNINKYCIEKTKYNNRKNIKKMIMQIFVCLMVYIVFYIATNSEYIFSENFKNDINKKYSNAKSYINENILKKNDREKNQVEKKEESSDNKGLKQENEKEKETDKEQKNQNEKTEEGVGGIKESEENIEKEQKKTQMDKDAEKIKTEISFIKPIDGRITSTFGWRNPTISTVPKYHTGIDLAANEGTIIKSATDGKVILVSSEGDYGNHYQIQINDVILIYAHCKKLYLKKGENVTQGQGIAEVGSTGNSTGPHLHFEIRIEDRKVDPQLILDL